MCGKSWLRRGQRSSSRQCCRPRRDPHLASPANKGVSATMVTRCRVLYLAVRGLTGRATFRAAGGLADSLPATAHLLNTLGSRTGGASLLVGFGRTRKGHRARVFHAFSRPREYPSLGGMCQSGRPFLSGRTGCASRSHMLGKSRSSKISWRVRQDMARWPKAKLDYTVNFGQEFYKPKTLGTLEDPLWLYRGCSKGRERLCNDNYGGQSR